MRRVLLATTIVGALVGTANADTVLTISGPINGNIVGPQSSSNPCIIAGTNCGNPSTFGYNNYTPNNASSLDRWSTSLGGSNGVNVAQGVQGTPYLVSALPTTFDIAIDVNTTGAASETLTLFEVWQVSGQTQTRLYHYDTSTVIGNVNNNGQGWADYTLSHIDLTGLPTTNGILFHAVWSNAVDGAESFFIVNGASPVPGPIVGAGIPGLISAALGMIGLNWRRRKKQLGIA